MSRPCCTRCYRPEIACICRFVTLTNNHPLVVVLQHPSEVNQSKGTLALLAKSLQNIVVIIGENFSNNEQLDDILSAYKHQAILLYPSEQAELILNDVNLNNNLNNNSNDIQANKCLILLDGTWKKAYRMYKLSTNLQRLQHVFLPEELIGRYQIRKTNKKNALSTLEACCYALAILEKKPEKYQPLLTAFDNFNVFQLSFIPQKD